MNDKPNSNEVIVRETKKLPAIWIVPLIALMLGIWMAVSNYLTRGPEITITFPTAEGIEAGKTKIKALSVDVGIVETVQLSKDLKNVKVIARIQHKAAALLREDSSFWVVRPRIGTSGVSGLNTLLSGAYIELAPGNAKQGARSFKGLDEAPTTAPTVPGLHLTLFSDEANSVSVGDPVLHRGYRVGRVENTKFDAETQKLNINIFIESPYDNLVSNLTRFWNSSGITFQASASGIKLQTSSLESLLVGGVAFDLPNGASAGEKVEDYYEFKLYADAASINENPYQHYEPYILLFDTSVYGLVEGAPVLYRGLRIGTVMGVSFKYLHIDETRTKDRSPQIPVLIHLEPGRWLGKDTQQAKIKAVADIEKSVTAGMRATLTTGNLLTGALIVSFDFFEQTDQASIKLLGDYKSIPTVSTGLGHIQSKFSRLLDKFNELPLNPVLQETNTTMEQITKTLISADLSIKELTNILENSDTQQLPESFNNTLAELQTTLQGISPDSDLYLDLSNSLDQLNSTLKSVERLSHEIESKPNSLIFSKQKSPDLQPQAAP